MQHRDVLSCGLLGPCCTSLCHLCLPLVVPVIVIQGRWKSCKIPDCTCVPKLTTVIHPPHPTHDAGQQGELITLKSLSCNTMWVQLHHLQTMCGLLSCTCVIRSLCGGAWKCLAVIFSLISLLFHWEEVSPWGGFFFMCFGTVYFLPEL